MSQNCTLKIFEEISKCLDLLQSLNAANADDEVTKINLEQRRAILRDNIRLHFENISENKEIIQKALIKHYRELESIAFKY